MEEVQVGKIRIGKGNPMVLIAGPCVLEDEGMALEVAEEAQEDLRQSRHSLHLQGFL